ncbi:MAG: transaldolase [Bdellovibrionota bacterium]
MNSLYKGKIKIYSDGADRASMLAMAADPRVQGLTTNPSLMKKSGISDYPGFCKDILKEIKIKPLSFEVFSDDLEGMEKQAHEIRTWGENVYVKIPITNSKGVTTIPLIKKLSASGVKLNVTALLTFKQIIETVEAVKGGAPSFVSVFAGRIADTGRDPIPVMTAASELCEEAGPDVELLWASTREVYNIVQAEQCGCHIITVPPDLIKKLNGFNKDLAAVSLDTVKTFKDDSDAAGFKL